MRRTLSEESCGTPSAGVHELLLRLAGSLPDDLVAQARSWLAADRPVTVARAVCFWTARNRIPLFDDEINTLAEILDRARADLGDLERLEVADAEPEPGYDFTAEPVLGLNLGWVTSVVDVVGGALVGLWIARRLTARGSPWPPPRRVYLLEASPGANLAAITGDVQRVLSAVERLDPLVETFTADGIRPYQVRALGVAQLVWSHAAASRPGEGLGPRGEGAPASARLGLPPVIRGCVFDLAGLVTGTPPRGRAWHEVLDGSVRYVTAVRAAGLGTAVVSSGPHVRDVLDAVGLGGHVEVCVDAVVAARSGLVGPPSPDTYLAAAAELNVPASAVAVFVGSPVGAEAGRSGGFGVVVGVGRPGQATSLRERGADRVVGELGELLEPAGP